jgi:hypothetical protein
MNRIADEVRRLDPILDEITACADLPKVRKVCRLPDSIAFVSAVELPSHTRLSDYRDRSLRAGARQTAVASFLEAGPQDGPRL